jgi:hypothetical protein
MTLKEKFMKLIEIPFKDKGVYIDINKVEECEKIADDYAIEFLIWASQFALQRFNEDRWQVLGLMDFGFTKTVSTREILEEYKKEKGL